MHDCQGTSRAELVGALKEVMGSKTREFVHVDLDVELDKLGLKAAFPLDLCPPSMAVQYKLLFECAREFIWTGEGTSN